MDDDIGKIKVIPDYFQPSTSEDSCPPNKPSVKSPSTTENCLRSDSYLWPKKRLRSAGFMFNLLNLKGLPWGSGADGQEKVELTAAELESLRTQLGDLEEREAHLKAQDGSHCQENLLLLMIQMSMTGFHALSFSMEHASFFICFVQI